MGKTENELWLEQIREIPKDEFQHIDSGGFGTVYKIKIQTELAVKIVRGVGTPSENDTQVRALQKEYAMVTSLDNQPRIIKYFGFVRDENKVPKKHIPQ